MKKSSKIISVALAVLMAASCFTGFTIFSASAADTDTKVYFEVPTLEEWGTTKSVYCHIDNVYGPDPITPASWQSKSEVCKKDPDTGLYYYDTSKLGEIKAGSDYLIIFSTIDSNKGVHQTCDMTFGVDCLGDTMYVTGEMIENPVDSTKVSFGAAWKENSDKYGPKAVITSTGKISGTYFPFYQPKAQVVSNFLHDYAVMNASIITPELVQADCKELGVNPADAFVQYANDFAEELAAPEAYPNTASLETIATLLGVEPTMPTTTEPTEPTTEPTEPTTTEPTEPTTEPTEPTTTEPTEPTTEPTEPTTTEPETTEPTTVPEPKYIFGDVNCDGVIDITDATTVQKIALTYADTTSSMTNYLADVNGDGRISIVDVTYIQKYIVGGYTNTANVGVEYVAGAM